MTDPGEQISQTLKREFAEEALDEQDGSRKLDGMFQHGIEVSSCLFFIYLIINRQRK